MSAFTINAGGVTEWDSLSGGSTNATLDSYTISNASVLSITTDTYQCANHSTAFGSLDTVAFTGIGGVLRIDPTAVRVLPFDTGTGTVPAIGTTISRSGASGALLGVWANWQSEPLAAGAAMPASGYIKLKSVSGGPFAAGALTGISANATGPDVQGWIEVRGADTATITVPRIGKLEVLQAWFELGTTTGVRGQILPCPTTATVAGVWPGVWIETSAGSGVYERFAGAGNVVAAATIPTDERGKIVWQTTSGIRIGSDGTNNVGFLPPTGCKVRIPAAILTCCTRTVSGSGPRVLPSATLTTRQEMVTTAAGAIDVRGAVFQWYANFAQAYGLTVKNSAFSDTIVAQEIATAIDIDDVIVAPTQAQINAALNLTSCAAGGTVQNSRFARFSMAALGAFVIGCSFCSNLVFTNVTAQTLTNRTGAAGGTVQANQTVDCQLVNCKVIGGRINVPSSTRLTITNLGYADQFSGTTGTGNAQYAIDLSSAATDCLVEGGNLLGLTNVQPYLGFVGLNATNRTRVRNIGTPAAPLNLGTTNGSAYLVEGTGNNKAPKVQRCYCSNTRTNLIAFTNTDYGVLCETVGGDYADAVAVVSNTSLSKGLRAAGTTTGQVSVYGTHWIDLFTAATTGLVRVLCNEPTTATADQCAITSGTPLFNSAGQVALTAVGQQVTWEMPYFALGHTALANLAPTLTGTNTGNLSYEFQYDFGSGYNGTWLTLNATNLNAAGAIDPTIGFRLKARATCTVANAGNLLTCITINTTTTSTAQNEEYTLDFFDLTLTNVVVGSSYRVEEQVSGALIAAGVAASSTVLIEVPVAATGDPANDLRIKVRKGTAAPYYKDYVTLATAVVGSQPIYIAQIPD